MQKSAEYYKPIYITFIDYEKGFYSVETPAVMEALKGHRVEVEETSLKLLEDIDEDCDNAL